MNAESGKNQNYLGGRSGKLGRISGSEGSACTSCSRASGGVYNCLSNDVIASPLRNVEPPETVSVEALTYQVVFFGRRIG